MRKIGPDAAFVILLVLALSSSACTAQPDAGPSPRAFAAAVYDSSRGFTVLFGGSPEPYERDYFLGDTWEWDGEIWTRRMEPGPSPRIFHAMAFDAQRNRSVLYGGDSTPFGGQFETWEWDGQVWHARGVTFLPLFFFHAMTYDSARNQTLLFGGWNTTVNASWSDTRAWDGNEWRLLSSSGAVRTNGHALAFDSRRNVTVLFGEGAEPRGDTWEWNGFTWNQVALTGPEPRFMCRMAYDSARGVTVLFGGAELASGNFEPFGDTWEWNGAAWTQVSSTGPSPRSGHVMAFDSARGVTVLFGGLTANGDSGETWEWDGTEWTLRHVTCIAECDTSTGVGTLDLFDFLCFQNLFVNSDPFACDCDTSTGPLVCDLFDFLCFQGAFIAGCP